MKYDPIMCMMVDDTVKSNDKKTVDASFNVVYKSNTGTMQVLVMAESEKEAEQKVRSREGSKFVSLIGVKKMSDSNTLDKAIKNCDVNKEEGFKIYNATVRNDTLYIEYEDLLHGRGKKEKESFTRTEAKKLLNDPWNTWLGTSKMVVKQFAG